MKYRNMVVRIPLAFICLIAAGLVALSCVNRKINSITIGKLSDKTADHSPQWYHITNASMGEKAGRYLTFSMKSGGRYHVAFDLSDPSADPAGVVNWVGFCEGVRVSKIPGCPCDPPFVLVTRAEPGSSTTNTD